MLVVAVVEVVAVGILVEQVEAELEDLLGDHQILAVAEEVNKIVLRTQVDLVCAL
jgi:hypothetical protein